MVIETLADSEAELRDRVADLDIERNAYREMSLAALDQLARTTALLDVARRRIIELQSKPLAGDHERGDGRKVWAA